MRDPADTQLELLSLHDALPILRPLEALGDGAGQLFDRRLELFLHVEPHAGRVGEDRKSTRLNSSHTVTSYAVFCLKKIKKAAVASHLCLTTTYNGRHHKRIPGH